MIVKVSLNRITPNPWQTRMGEADATYIKELGEDIASHTLLQTPVGRLVHSDGRVVNEIGHSDPVGVMGAGTDIQVQLAFGHNRLEAFRWLNDLRDHSNIEGDWSSMPVDVRLLSDEQMAIMAWSENERRRDVTPVERAKAIEKRMADFGWTQQQAAEQLGISRPAVSNALRLLKLPEEVLWALEKSKISERAAMALAGLYDLPAGLLKVAEAREWGDTKPSLIMKNALDGLLTSDDIRSRVQKICTSNGEKLEEAEWGLDEIASAWVDIEVLKSATCRDCELRIKERNICLDRECFSARRQEARRQYLEKASQVSGIALAEKTSGNHYNQHIYTEFDGYDKVKKGISQKAVASGCENLRLVHRSYKSSYEMPVDAVEGYAMSQIVCQKRKGFCTCLQALEAATPAVKSEYNQATREFENYEVATAVELKSKQPTAEELNDLAEQAKQLKKDARQYAKWIVERAGEMIGDALRAGNVTAWKRLAQEVHYKCGQEEASMTGVQDAIGRQMAEKGLPYEYKTQVEVERAMARMLEAWGAEVDWERFPELKGQQESRLAAMKAEGEAIAARCEAEGKTLVELWSEEEA